MALVVKNLPANVGDKRDLGSIPGLGRSPGEGNGYPLQYSCPENPLDAEAWQAAVHRVAKSRTQLKWLSMYTFTLFQSLELNLQHLLSMPILRAFRVLRQYESACRAAVLGSIPGSGRSPGEGNPPLFSGPGRGAWQATVHEVVNSWTRLSD